MKRMVTNLSFDNPDTKIGEQRKGLVTSPSGLVTNSRDCLPNEKFPCAPVLLYSGQRISIQSESFKLYANWKN